MPSLAPAKKLPAGHHPRVECAAVNKPRAACSRHITQSSSLPQPFLPRAPHEQLLQRPTPHLQLPKVSFLMAFCMPLSAQVDGANRHIVGTEDSNVHVARGRVSIQELVISRLRRVTLLWNIPPHLPKAPDPLWSATRRVQLASSKRRRSVEGSEGRGQKRVLFHGWRVGTCLSRDMLGNRFPIWAADCQECSKALELTRFLLRLQQYHYLST